jgi:hypothetical protein
LNAARSDFIYYAQADPKAYDGALAQKQAPRAKCYEGTHVTKAVAEKSRPEKLFGLYLFLPWLHGKVGYSGNVPTVAERGAQKEPGARSRKLETAHTR